MSGRYVTGTGQVIVHVHEPYQCHGPWCVIHNPAPGPWNDWPTTWVEHTHPRSMINGWMGRVCPHGIPHPCVEDNVPYVVAPHHLDCDGCPCGPEHIGSSEPRPLDANGTPARKVDELSLRDRFQLDQDEAIAMDTLNNLVGALVTAIIAEGGNHPGRLMVSTEYLDIMNGLAPNQVRIVMQYAAWALAENALLAMEVDGVLAERFGIQLGKGFHDDGE